MPAFTTRPVILARKGVVTSGHYLATAAGFRILAQGGNAIDAAAATCFVLNLVEPHNNGLGGEAPTLIYSAKDKQVYSVSGMGWSPAAFTVDWCRLNGIDLIPGDGYLPACVPATLATWCLALARFGTLSFAQVAAPAIELAEDGFPLYSNLHETIINFQQIFRDLYPSTGRIYLPGGRVPDVGERLRNLEWAGVLKRMAQAEVACGKGRVAGIEAARDMFYKGEIAGQIVDYITTHPVLDASGQAHTGMLTTADFADWHAVLEEPVRVDYHGLQVHKCSTWTQGPVFLQQLTILEGYDLKSLGHNSAQYLHTLIECAKLAFADREAYSGDPDFDQVPLDVLLSHEYAAQRRSLVGEMASPDMRPGAIGGIHPDYATRSVLEDNRRGLRLTGNGVTPPSGRGAHTGDTTHLDTVDGQGNMVACTPSGGWFHTSPVIEGLGFPLGTRGQMFYLNPERPNALQPHKRPRATLTPTLVMKNGEPYLAFGTQGGDAQDQWTLQFFLNVVDFGMDLQAALDAPSIHIEHFPSSFYPREAFPRQVSVETRLPQVVLDELEQRGHIISPSGEWAHGRVLAVAYDQEHQTLKGAASPKGLISYAMGW